MLSILRNLYQKSIQPSIFQFTVHPVRSHHYIWPRKKFLIQAEVECGTAQYLKLQKCNFRTTQHLYIPPIVAIILRPALRVGAFLMGRSIKKWWARKSDKEKEEYKQWFRERRNVFLGGFGLYGFIICLYYITHLETDPLTQRSKFIIFNKEQEKMLGDMFVQIIRQSFKPDLVSQNHPAYKRVERVIKNILNSNKDLKSIKETQWTLTVINLPLKNSFILPGGHIFVSLDILKLTENDDQLGFVLAHEIAHSILSHQLEVLSTELLLDFLMVVPILLIWALFPDIMAAIIHMTAKSIMNIMNLQYSRNLETEADEIGIKLAAKACIDIREAVVFWATMRTLTEMDLLPAVQSWKSTHPSPKDREKNLNEAMTKALELRQNSGCSVLPSVDPRVNFYKRSPKEQEIYFRQRGIIEEKIKSH